MAHPSQIGPYPILGELGPGLIGVYYHSRDERRGRDVTIKALSPDQVGDAELVQRLTREGQVLARIRHPNVAAIYDLGAQADGSPYLVMEALKGRSLGEALRSPPPVAPERMVDALAAVLSGLESVHRAGMVHRNVTPASILVREDGRVAIFDFSIAKPHSLARSWMLLGTPSYMSPEQARGYAVEKRSDLFSAGCVLFEVLAGAQPFCGDSALSIAYKIITSEPDLDLIPAGACRGDLLTILRKALAKNPDDRYPDARSMLADLTPLTTEGRSARGRPAGEE